MVTASPTKKRKPHVTNNSGQNEWFTPSKYLDAARAVLGEIDLDPASNPAANKVVKAIRYFTKDDSGLEQEWSGKVWMNPPYSKELLPQFISKFVASVNAGTVTEAIVLVNNATETHWYQTLQSASDAVVFPKGRIKFISPTGLKNSPLQGQSFFYFGSNPKKFLSVFAPFGHGYPSAGEIKSKGAPKFGTNVSESKTIEVIQRHRRSGKSYRQIADYLNQNGYPTKRSGSKWSHKTVKSILDRAIA